jgi:hypothetical protein
MQVRNGEICMPPSGRRDRLTARDVRALAHEQRCQPRAGARHSAAMVDREEELAPDGTGERHDAVHRREDRRADRRGDIDAAVTRAVRGVRRIEPSDDRARDRP